ncbi:MAG TPA: helix-turn-helix domain-containing protein [Allosphingosinicella sp.]|nr:helix-turn-helix domain-containing protein [Allosphingosinicella sp.]
MDLGQIDVAIRVGGVVMILFLAWLLFRQRRRVGVPALLFAPMAICLSGFLIGNTPDPSLRLSGTAATIAHFASGWAVVFLWWFCLACFDRQFRPRGPVLAVGLAWILLAGAARIIPQPLPLMDEILVGLGFGIVGHLIWRLLAEREGDLIQKRHDARFTVALILGGLLLVDLLVDLIMGFAWRPLPFAMAQNLVILLFAGWLAGRVLDVRAGVLSFELSAPAAAETIPVEGFGEDSSIDDALRQRLAGLIEEERIHLDPDLTFADFVQRTGASERVVRRLVNHELGFDHFRSFLNHYRMMEARALLADPNRAGDKLIAIAMDSGFASLPSFNRVFRAIEGRTPSDYRNAAAAARAKGHAEAAKSPSQTGFEKRSAVF